MDIAGDDDDDDEGDRGGMEDLDDACRSGYEARVVRSRFTPKGDSAWVLWQLRGRFVQPLPGRRSSRSQEPLVEGPGRCCRDLWSSETGREIRRVERG